MGVDPEERDQGGRSAEERDRGGRSAEERDRGGRSAAGGSSGHPTGISPRARWIVGGAIGAMYATSSSIRGEVLPGVVGGVLAAILCWLVLREVAERRRRRGL